MYFKFLFVNYKFMRYYFIKIFLIDYIDTKIHSNNIPNDT